MTDRFVEQEVLQACKEGNLPVYMSDDKRYCQLIKTLEQNQMCIPLSIDAEDNQCYLIRIGKNKYNVLKNAGTMYGYAFAESTDIQTIFESYFDSHTKEKSIEINKLSDDIEKINQVKLELQLNLPEEWRDDGREKFFTHPSSRSVRIW